MRAHRIAASALFLGLGAGSLVGAAPARAAEEPDILFRAMKDEMDRSTKRLKLEDGSPPYYMAYTVTESDEAQAAASFGALTGKGKDRTRSLGTDVRVGDYSMDSSNFGDGFDFLALLGITGMGGATVSVDDDYDALRNAIWEATDGAYKEAVEQLEKKKAFLQANEVKDRPDDFSKETPTTVVEGKATLEADVDAWAETAKKASAVFREFPGVQTSHAMFVARARNRWFVNSEGFRSRRGWRECGFILLAGAQAADGMRLADFEIFPGRTPKDLPSEETILQAARSLAERLTRLAAAPTAEVYRGPVLFEGPAAAEFLSQAVTTHVGGAHVTLGSDNPMSAAMGNQWKEKLGQKVMAGFLTLSSDPTADEYKGAPILGGWKVDDDGVPARKVTLVEKGVLKTFCHARIPSREIRSSNGHSRGGSGAPGTLFLESENRLAPKDLRARAFEIAKEEGLDHVVVVRRLANLLTAALNPQATMSSFMGAFTGGAGGIVLLPPIAAFKVSIADGTETPIRGATFGGATLRLLRDIEATGDDDAAHAVLKGPENVGCVVTPSLLVKELELKKPGKETEKLPVLPNPWFEGKEKK